MTWPFKLLQCFYFTRNGAPSIGDGHFYFFKFDRWSSSHGDCIWDHLGGEQVDVVWCESKSMSQVNYVRTWSSPIAGEWWHFSVSPTDSINMTHNWPRHDCCIDLLGKLGGEWGNGASLAFTRGNRGLIGYPGGLRPPDPPKKELY